MADEVTTSFIETDDSAAGVESITFCWRSVAGSRLIRLIELEHDYGIMRDRLERLQAEYGALFSAGEIGKKRIYELEKLNDAIAIKYFESQESVAELNQRHAAMEAEFLGSRSWRLTRPLRGISTFIANKKHLVAKVLRRMLRVSAFRRIARIVARCMPGVAGCVRSTLYPRSRMR